MQLFPAGSRVVVAVSGGADSVALMHFLSRCELFTGAGKNRLLVAHFDHNLRSDSAEDRRFVENAARDLGLESVVELWAATPANGNLPAQARQARYNFLIKTATEFSANCLTTGHHQDDQVETFMDRLIRGSGLTGLRAMAAVRSLENATAIKLIRPLLTMDRVTIQNWLRIQNIEWREDPSNQNTDYRRAYLRHKVLPLLSSLEPNTMERIAATTQRIAQAQEALEWSLEQRWPDMEERVTEQGLTINQAAMITMPDELVILALRRCQKTVTKSDHPPSEKAGQEFITLVRSKQKQGEIRIRGLKISKGDKRLVFCGERTSPRQNM
ncbi:MAG: tRNA lysidine(34) synthetase TilS [Magnetococcales bacterium]|nr:tRNA lysidine(34) synthetase TilS [Magnetococcales bacterium]